MSVSRIPKQRSEKRSLARVAGEIGVAMVALTIVVGGAVFLPIALSRSQVIVVTAVIAIALAVLLAAAGSRRRYLG